MNDEPMVPMKCPNCGAPAVVQPGQTLVPCSFCGSSFSAPPPPSAASPYAAASPPPVQPIVIVAPGESYGRAPRKGYLVAARLIMAIPAVAALTVGGIGVYTANRASSGMGMRSLGLGGWNGSTPLVCGGNDTVEASGITATYTSGSAFSVGGNCHVTCTGCTLKAPVVVAAGGNAEVDLVDCQIEGTPQAIVAGGNAKVLVTGRSTVIGKVDQDGNATVVAPPSATVAPSSKAAPAPTLRSGPSPAVPGHVPSKPR